MTWRDLVLTVLVSATVSLIVSLLLSYLSYRLSKGGD